MTQDAQIVMDDFTEICRKAGNTVYNQGVVDGLVNLKNLINDNENITIEELKAVIDEFIKKSTVGSEEETKKEIKISSSMNEETEDSTLEDEGSHIDFSKPMPIEGLDHSIEEIINKKNDEIRPESSDALGMMGGLFGGLMGGLTGSMSEENNESEVVCDGEAKEASAEEVSK